MPEHAQAIEIPPYTLLDRIGEGGSGWVYRASGPEGPVAVKLLAPGGATDDAARARFVREVVALQHIVHPNLVRMLGHGVDAELGPYLVLPLLSGTSLRALCAGRSLCPEAALLLLQPLVRATAALHAGGFVHRDLKPENAIAAPDGTVTLIDLGLAWRDDMTRHTETGTAIGSVGYMAPEQIEGRPVGGRADVWALGVMLYEMIAGKRPFARPRPAEEAAAALVGACPRLTAADRRTREELAELIARCLAPDPAARPTASELTFAVDALIDWTDAIDVDRAAVVTDPVAYQTRIAPFRVRRFERLAREALDAGAPFAALAHCDRGLAYTPEDPGLLAMVIAAEAATAAAVVEPRATLRRRRWPWLVAGIATSGIAASIAATVSRAHAEQTPDPWGAAPNPGATQSEHPLKLPDAQDLTVMKHFVGVFGRAMQHAPRDPKAPMTAEDRALVGDIVGVVGEIIDRIEDQQHGTPAKP